MIRQIRGLVQRGVPEGRSPKKKKEGGLEGLRLSKYILPLSFEGERDTEGEVGE
jgi:hypothetical protein